MSTTIESIRSDPKKSIERVACRIYLGSNQGNLVDGTFTKVLLDTVTHDLGKNFDIVTNNRFDVPVSGLYKVWGKVDFVNTIADKDYVAAIYVDGSAISYGRVHTGDATNEIDALVNDEIYLRKDAYVELFAQSNSGGNTVDIKGASTDTFLGLRLIMKEGIKQ